MITTTVTPEHTGVLFLGRKGEKDARKFVFDMSNWIREMVSAGAPIGEVILLVLRPRERTPYRATVTVSGTDLVWVPQPEDLAKTGEGSIELQMITPGGAILKSAIIHTRAEGCLGDSEGPAPEDQPGWFRQVLENTEDVLEAAKDAEAAAKRAEAAAEDAESGVLIAEYGVTPNAELREAWADGRTIVCKNGEYVYTLESVRQSGTWFNFVSIYDHIIRRCHCAAHGYWTEDSYDIIREITPERIGALPALGESISDPETNIDELTLTKCYLCGASVIKKGLKGDLPFDSSFLLKVDDYTGDGRRAIQTATKNSSTSPVQKWRLWNGNVWSAWQEG